MSDVVKYLVLGVGGFLLYETFFKNPALATAGLTPAPVGPLPTVVTPVTVTTPAPTATVYAQNPISSSPNEKIQLTIDSPVDGAQLSGPNNVLFGWFIDATVDTQSVVVMIDGAVVGSASIHVSRGDVCQVWPGYYNCPNVGWQYTLDVSQLLNGPHTVTILATSVTGQSTAQSKSINVANSIATVNPVQHISCTYSNGVPSAGCTLSGLPETSTRKKSLRELMNADMPHMRWGN